MKVATPVHVNKPIYKKTSDTSDEILFLSYEMSSNLLEFSRLLSIEAQIEYREFGKMMET